MSQDSLLIDHIALQSIKGNFSANIEADQVDPYIIEAQTGEIRRFLGDELYLLLLQNFSPDIIPLFYNFALYSGIRIGVSCTGCNPDEPAEFYNAGTGWDLGLSNATPSIVIDFLVDIPAQTFIGFVDISAYTGVADYNISLTLEDESGATIDTDSITPATSTGRKTYTLTNPTSQKVSLTILSLQADPVSISGVSLDGQEQDVSFFPLMKGIDYINSSGQLVRFNGLEECLKYWTYYRYLRDADLLALSFGNRQAEDSIYSSAMAREQVKRGVYNAKSKALQFQADAERFIDANINLYPSFRNNRRIKRTSSFEINKVPRTNNNIFPFDHHHPLDSH